MTLSNGTIIAPSLMPISKKVHKIECSYCSELTSRGPFCSEKCRKTFEQIAFEGGSTSQMRQLYIEVKNKRRCNTCNKSIEHLNKTHRYCNNDCWFQAFIKRKPYVLKKILNQ